MADYYVEAESASAFRSFEVTQGSSGYGQRGHLFGGSEAEILANGCRLVLLRKALLMSSGYVRLCEAFQYLGNPSIVYAVDTRCRAAAEAGFCRGGAAPCVMIETVLGNVSNDDRPWRYSRMDNK